jgi:PPOX class probable F420-dependent enzyme
MLMGEGGRLMNWEEGIEFLKRHKQAIFATIRFDGRPQLSNVLTVYDEGSLLISITETRAKYRNLVRDPRATVLVQGDNFWQYLVVDGNATLVHLPEALPLLIKYYRLAAGEHPNWEEYAEAMQSERRVVAIISIDHLYPLSSG